VLIADLKHVVDDLDRVIGYAQDTHPACALAHRPSCKTLPVPESE
jgi:hypothetical protein